MCFPSYRPFDLNAVIPNAVWDLIKVYLDNKLHIDSLLAFSMRIFN